MDIIYQYYLKFLEYLGVPDALSILLWYVIPFALAVCALMAVVIVLVLMERKVLALFTVRKGPNRVGFWGCLQTIADAIKLLCKEDLMPKGARKFLFNLAPILVFVPIIMAWGIVPYSNKYIPVASGVSLLLFLAVLTFPCLGVLLAGYSSNNKFSLMGAMRSAAQIVSYEIPMMLSALGIVILSSSLNLNNIVLSQSATTGILGWYFIPSFVGFCVFFICALAETNRAPFDLPEAESELVSGYNTEYSGMKFAMFFLAEYAAMFIMAIFIACLYFGGYLPPLGFYVSEVYQFNYVLNNSAVYFEQVFWLLSKTLIILFVMMWIRAALPRLRSDQLMKFAWKFLIPLSALNFFIVCAVKFLQGGIAG